MDGADLAQEARSKTLQHAIYLDERTPKPVHRIGVVGPMNGVPLEWNRVRDFVWFAIDFSRNSEVVRQFAEALVEISHAHWLQYESSSRAVGGGADQAMIYEVEVELHAPTARRDQGCRQAAGRDIERRVPGMVYPWGVCETVLANNLGP